MINFDVKIVGLEEIKAAFDKAPALVQPILHKAIVDSSATLAKNTTPDIVPIGATKQLYKTFQADIGELYARWFPTVKYAKDVEFGRGPTRIPKGSLEYESLKKWADYKGANFRQVLHGIETGGTSAHPYIKRILQVSQAEIDRIFVKAGNDITKKLASK